MGNSHLDFSATDRPPDEITDGLKHLSSSYRMSLMIMESWKSCLFVFVAEEFERRLPNGALLLLLLLSLFERVRRKLPEERPLSPMETSHEKK